MNSRANESSPNQPTPRLAAVMPICVTARYSVTPSTRRMARLAAAFPSPASSSRRVRRTRTMANSAATNTPLTITSRRTARIESRSLRTTSTIVHALGARAGYGRIVNGASMAAMTSTIAQPSTRPIFQMSRAYSATVRSLENRPMRLTFMIAFATHEAGCRNSSATLCWVAR